MQILSLEHVRKDKRGKLTQVTSRFPGQQLNILEIKKGQVMGGHFHNRTHEIFYILKGMVSIYTFKESDNDGKIVELGQCKCFTIGTREYHYIEAIRNSILVVLLSQPYNPENPDIHTAGLVGKAKEVKNGDV